MPKVKIPRKSTTIDMTAMCDVAFLLLTFFMLTTKFKPEEVIPVDIPSSISEIILPETDILMITIDKEGTVYFGEDGQFNRIETLDKMAKHYNLTFTEAQKKQFSLVESFGVPVNQLKQFLDMPAEDRKKIKQPGIPADSLDNQLAYWVLFARQSNPKFNVTVKGDRESNYPAVKKVIAALQSRDVNKFYFITNMEQAPAH